MSGNDHQMERGYSARSLSSRGGSEMGSRYVMESGIYMTSFAATIIMAGLAAVGLLLVTLVIALTVMLQSCESKSKGIVEISKLNEYYNYCNIFSLHAELNNLDADDFPEICKVAAIQYVKDGQFARDLNFTMEVIENYFNSVEPQDSSLNLVLVDMDDFLPASSPLQSRFSQCGYGDCLKETKNLKHKFILKLYTRLQASEWSLILFSRKPQKQRNATIGHLISAGFSGWSSLIMRLDDELQMNSGEYFSRHRNILQNQGFRITAVISSRLDALTGPWSGTRMFKLPNPIYLSNIPNSEHYSESMNLPQ